MQDLKEEQLSLEKEMIGMGVHRYMSSIQGNETKGYGADTGYANKLIRESLVVVADRIRAESLKTTPGRNGKARKLLREIDPYLAGYIAMRGIMNRFLVNPALTGTCISIGGMIEDELRAKVFSSLYPEYFQAILDDLKRKGSRNQATIHRIITNHMLKKDIAWAPWDLEDKICLGALLVDIIMSCTDLCTKETLYRNGRQLSVIQPTSAAVQWVQKYTEDNAVLRPMCGPCVIKPDDWVSFHQGGFYHPRMRIQFPMVKNCSRLAKERLRNPPSTTVQALNVLQRTAWDINREVLSTLQEAWSQGHEIGLPRAIPYPLPESPVPPDLKRVDMTPSQLESFKLWKFNVTQTHSLNKERVSKCFSVLSCLRDAHKYSKYSEMYFVYQCDFRGRMYPVTSSLSPQGADFNRALLRFKEGKPLRDGYLWFLLHGANTYGIDKVSFKDRLAWVEKHSKDIQEFAKHPFSAKEFWSKADKPWQFYAWALEYIQYLKQGPSFVSHLPIGLDGSCNGIQNYSAMLRDSIGGAAVNLTPQEKPADLYTAVAECLSKLVQESQDPALHQWARYLAACGGTYPRGLCKRPVMTLVYGVTRHSVRDYVVDFLRESASEHFLKKDTFRQGSIITPLLWKAMGQVVVASFAAMQWIQQCAKVAAANGHGISWHSPVGFPVVQERKRRTMKQITTAFQGKCRMAYRREDARIDLRGQQQSAAPNFIHSMDAAHAQLTLAAASAAGITAFCTVHDDFGVHACDTDVFFQIIREEFVRMYTVCDPLLEFKNTIELETGVELPELPTKGTLDLTKVLDSLYFFC